MILKWYLLIEQSFGVYQSRFEIIPLANDGSILFHVALSNQLAASTMVFSSDTSHYIPASVNSSYDVGIIFPKMLVASPLVVDL